MRKGIQEQESEAFAIVKLTKEGSYEVSKVVHMNAELGRVSLTLCINCEPFLSPQYIPKWQ